MALKNWQLICRQHAERQARQEARKLWHVRKDKSIPFNHRWEHVQEVVRLALWLSKAVGADPEVVEAAAWLHDVCKEEPKHAIAGAAEAQRILVTTDFPVHKIEAVVSAIRQHEGLKRPTGAPPLQPLEAAILWDADKLTKLGVQALVYLLSSGYLAGQSLAERRRSCTEYVQKKLRETVISMNTEPARRVAEERQGAMIAFLAAWERDERQESE